MSNGKRAARWVRVSSGGQNEKSQLPVIDEACTEHDLTVVRTFTLHDKSASKGEHEAEQNRAVEAMASGEFDVIVCTESDRLDRRGPRAAYAFLYRLEIAAGRPDVVIVAGDPQFGQDDIGSEVLATVRMASARDEVKLKSRRVNEEFRAMDGNGALRGTAPAGYEITGSKYAKQLVPAEERRVVRRKRRKGAVEDKTLPSAADIRQAFEDAVTDSTAVLGKRLGMNPVSVAAMLRNKVYSTGQYQVKRADGVTVAHKCQPLVTPAQQNRAVKALADRLTGDAVSSRKLAKDDYSGAVFCDMCEQHSAMHRYYNGTRDARYRCGSCRKSVDAGKADAAVNAFMLARQEWYLESVWIDGNDHQAGLDRVQMELRELAGRGLDDDKEDAERSRLRAERKRLEGLPRETGHWQPRFSGMTEGQRWEKLTTSERRAWLAGGEFRVFARSGGARTGIVNVDLEYADDDRVTDEELAARQAA